MKKKVLLIALTILPIILSAQKNIRKDSISLFRITEDNLTSGREITKSKGYISNIDIQDNGQINFTVLKQTTGYFSPEKKKGLSAGINTIPGLVKITFNENGLQKKDDYLLNLNSGLKNPIKYTLSDITSTTGGVSAKEVISNETMGKDLSTALTEDAKGFNYTGNTLEIKGFDIENGSFVYQNRKYAFVPYIGQYLYFSASPKVKLPIKFEPNAYFINYSENSITYFQSKQLGGKPSIITADSTGKIISRNDIAELGDLAFASNTRVQKYNQANIVSSSNLREYKGSDWLFAPAPKSGLEEYMIIRVNEKGEIIFKHKFTVKSEGFSYAQSAVVSNQDDCFIRIITGKGLRYQTFFIKVAKDGVSYTHLVDKDNERKTEVINSSGRSTSVGDFKYNILVSLPNNELLVGGHDFMTTKGTYDYSFMHLSKDGEIKKYYNTTSHTPKDLKIDLPPFFPIVANDGRILLFTNEARISGNPLATFGNLDKELEQGFPQSTKDFLVDLNSKNLFINQSTVKKEPEKTSSGLFGKLEKLSGGLEAVTAKDFMDSGIAKEKINMDDEVFLYSTGLNIIDLNANKIQRFDLGKSGGYSIPNNPFFAFNKEKNQITIISRTLPTSEMAGRKSYPKSVYLKTTVIGL